MEENNIPQDLKPELLGQPSPDKIKVFKQDAVLDIKIGVDYYQRFSSALMFYLKDRTEEELANAVEQMTSNDIKDEWVFHYFTFLIFLKTCENYADNHNLSELITKEEFDRRAAEMVAKAEASEQDAAKLSTQVDTGLDSHA